MTHKLWTIHRILHDLLGISEEEIGEDFSLRHASIGSLTGIELVMQVEDKYNVRL